MVITNPPCPASCCGEVLDEKLYGLTFAWSTVLLTLRDGPVSITGKTWCSCGVNSLPSNALRELVTLNYIKEIRYCTLFSHYNKILGMRPCRARMHIYDGANLFQGQVTLSFRRGLCDFVAWTEVTVDGFTWWKIQSRKHNCQSAVIMLLVYLQS